MSAAWHFKVSDISSGSRRTTPNKEAVRVLLHFGSVVDAADNDGKTTLMYAAGNVIVSEGVVCMLLEAGAEVDATDKHGMTARMRAANDGNKAVCLLLQAGAVVDATSTHGKTALIYAAIESKKEAVRLLLEAGAAVGAKDNNGQTALMSASTEAKNKGWKETTSLLMKAEASVSKRTNANMRLMQKETATTRRAVKEKAKFSVQGIIRWTTSRMSRANTSQSL
jgi:ankyrin repeat protein